MKKRTLSIGLLLAALTALFAWRVMAAPVNFAWDYDFSVDPACSPTKLADCVKEFRIKEGAIVRATVPAPAGATAPVVGIQGTVNFGPPYGNRTVFVVAVSDNGTESDPSNSVQVPAKPGKPQNVRVP